ncbi:MAG: sel1 repeat family protein [Candidatus Riflebacteria bacterium]|nr:sel1 repeat family protein [Candidatus Riflebacteria bacterium]
MKKHSTTVYLYAALFLAIFLATSLCAVQPTRPEHFAIREMLQKNDGERAFKAAKLLAEKGDNYGNYVAGLLCMGQFGMKADWPLAVRYMEKAAASGCGDAESVLGAILCDGPKVIFDAKKAVVYLEKAAAKNVPAALDMLARLYSQGLGVRKDLKKAREYFAKAADLGHPPSQKRLGLMLFDGEGGKADQKSAVVWLTRAGSTGNANALFVLGHLCETGKQMPKDLVEAAKNYILAATKPEAVTALEKLKNSLSVTQYEEAQRRAKAWQKSEPWRAGSTAVAQMPGSSATTQQQRTALVRQTSTAASKPAKGSPAPEVDLDNVSAWPQPERIMSIEQIEKLIISDYCAE